MIFFIGWQAKLNLIIYGILEYEQPPWPSNETVPRKKKLYVYNVLDWNEMEHVSIYPMKVESGNNIYAFQKKEACTMQVACEHEICGVGQHTLGLQVVRWVL